jgi:hypothetical protein
MLFVRPHDLALAPHPEGAAVIRHIKITGAFAKIDALLGAKPITAMLPFHRLSDSGLSVGVRVDPLVEHGIVFGAATADGMARPLRVSHLLPCPAS